MADTRETEPSAKDRDPKESSPSVDKQAASAPAGDKAAKLLIVDDSVTIRMSLRDLLAQEGFEVLLADSREAALESLRSQSLQLLMLDLVIPGGSGRDFLKEIKADEKLAAIPVLILTAESDQAEIDACRDLGADDFISKPWEESDLLAKVRALAHPERKTEGAEKPGDGKQAEDGGKDQTAAAPADKPSKSKADAKETRKSRVLIVDDSATICNALTHELPLGGLDAVAVNSGPEAIALVRSEKFDVAIVDVLMPVMDGEELIRRLADCAPELPCIVLTGTAKMDAVRRMAVAPNVAGILVKPWDRKRLMETLKSAMERRTPEPANAGS